jgi:hypothetical protein
MTFAAWLVLWILGSLHLILMLQVAFPLDLAHQHTPAWLPLKASLVLNRLTIQNYKCGHCGNDITVLDELQYSNMQPYVEGVSMSAAL